MPEFVKFYLHIIMAVVFAFILSTGCHMKTRSHEMHENCVCKRDGKHQCKHKHEADIEHMEDEKPPTQKYVDPDTGNDGTGDYLRLQWQEYTSKRDAIFKNINADISSGGDPAKLCRRPENDLEDLQEQTRQSMKNIINFGDVKGEKVFEDDMVSWRKVCDSSTE